MFLSRKTSTRFIPAPMTVEASKQVNSATGWDAPSMEEDKAELEEEETETTTEKAPDRWLEATPRNSHSGQL